MYIWNPFSKSWTEANQELPLNYADVNFCHSSRSRSVSSSYQRVNQISPTTPLTNSRRHVNKALFETVLPKQIRANAFALILQLNQI